MAHLRQAIGYQDSALRPLVGIYLVGALLGWCAVMILSLALGDYFVPRLDAQLALIAWLPGYRALDAIVTGPDCGGALPRARLAYGAGLAFILFCWLCYLLLVLPRYLWVLRALARKVVVAGPGDVTLDLGWKRASFRFLPASLAALWLFFTLAAFTDSLIYPHLIAFTCTEPWVGPGGGRAFRWRGHHWAQLQILWCGLATLAPHALLLLDQAWVMTHGGKRADPPRRPRPQPRQPAAKAPPASPPRRHRESSGVPLEQVFANAARRWRAEASQAMRANDHYPTGHMADSQRYYEHLARAARKLRGRRRRAAGDDDPALKEAERELAQKALNVARTQLTALPPGAPERSAAEDAVADLLACLEELDSPR